MFGQKKFSGGRGKSLIFCFFTGSSNKGLLMNHHKTEVGARNIVPREVDWQ